MAAGGGGTFSSRVWPLIGQSCLNEGPHTQVYMGSSNGLSRSFKKKDMKLEGGGGDLGALRG